MPTDPTSDERVELPGDPDPATDLATDEAADADQSPNPVEGSPS
jgi:hypothetical protein